MGRPLRIEYPGALYHVTSRGNERNKIFLDDSDRIKFLDILEDYHERFGILTHSYVLMDNHYHLVLETPQGNLLKVMHSINSRYTGYFNRKYGRAGHLFQGRYKGILVDKEAYLLEVSRYVHLNPARAKMTEKLEMYEWSSYGGYIGKRKEFKWVEYGWVLSRFGRDREKARGKYKGFVEEGLKRTLGNPFKDVYGQVVLGEEGFKERIKKLLKGQAISKEIVERKRLTSSPRAEDILREVASMFGVSGERIKRKGGRYNKARRVAIYLVKRYSGLSNKEVGEIFGEIHYSAVSKASARVEIEMAEDKKLSKLVEALNSKIKT